MTRIYGTIALLLALCGLLLMPQASHATDTASTGTVKWIRTCPDGGGGQKVVIHIDLGDGVTTKTIFLGVEASGTSAMTSIATAAMLSGRTVTVYRSSNAAPQCGIQALYGNATTHYIQMN